MDKTELEQLLTPFSQQHLLQFWDELDETGQQSLASQIKGIDWSLLQKLAKETHAADAWSELAERAEVPPAITLEDFRDPDSSSKAYSAGGKALGGGKVAFVLVAGGQGSRLGFDNPKGMYPIGPVSQRSLYQMIIEHVHARAKQFDATIPIYIMTSPPTHAASEKFLTDNNWFGYPPEDIKLFCQGVMPAVDAETGKALLAEKGKVFVSPDGHGGTLGGLARSGCLADMKSRGIEQVFYGQIDNPLLQVCDPALVGYHILHESEMTSQVVRKESPLQKVGNVVSVDGVVQIIEYSDLPENCAKKTNEDGSLKLWAGSIAVHVFDRAFLQRVSDSADGLPFHRAHKKVAFVDSEGNSVKPESNNAIKFERFIFDLLPNAKNAIVCEVDAREGFAAVKNAPPADTETPDWVREAISNLHRSWVQQAGGTVAEGAVIEINPQFAVEPKLLVEKLDLNQEYSGNVYLQ